MKFDYLNFLQKSEKDIYWLTLNLHGKSQIFQTLNMEDITDANV